jgi:hypothetical protein
MNIPKEVARAQGHHGVKGSEYGKKGGRPKGSYGPSKPVPEEATREAKKADWLRRCSELLGGGKNLDLEKERQRMANRASYHRNKKPKPRKSRGREPWEVWKARFDQEQNAKKRFEMANTRLRSTGDDEFAELVEVIALEAEAAKAAGRRNFEEREAARQVYNTPEAKAARKAWVEEQKAAKQAAKAASRASQKAAKAAKAAEDAARKEAARKAAVVAMEDRRLREEEEDAAWEEEKARAEAAKAAVASPPKPKPEAVEAIGRSLTSRPPLRNCGG